MSIEDNKAKIDALTRAMQPPEMPYEIGPIEHVEDARVLRMIEDALIELGKQNLNSAVPTSPESDE